jgi:predicted outer membrane protein
MSRRFATVGFIAALMAAPAFAQQQAPVSPIPANPVPAETQTNQGLGSNAQQRQQRVQQGGAPQDTQTLARQGQNSAPAGMGQQQSQADAQYIQQTLATGTVSLQESNFALSKAQNPRVKMFAQFEVAEQNTLADVMHSFSDPASTASTAGAKQAAATAPELPAADAAVMEKMSKAQPGAAFDKDYVAAQIKGHQDLLAIQERYIQAASGNRETMNIAKLARGQIKEHLTLLQDMQKEIGR